MKTLVNKIDLTTYNNDGMIDIPTGSRLEYIETKTSLHAYYEIFTYVISCNLINEDESKTPVDIKCSKYVGTKNYKVDCVKGNLHKRKMILWNEVFNEEFPE